MQLVDSSTPSLAHDLAGLPLAILLADGDAIARAKDGADTIVLTPPFHVADDDSYLVLPEDIGVDLVEMFRDGDTELLEEAMRDGLVVIGALERIEGKRGAMLLRIESSATPSELLASMPYADAVRVALGESPITALNELPQAQNTMSSALIDEDGLSSVLRNEEFAGVSWRVPEGRDDLAGVDPTYVWSRRVSDRRVGIEAALFCEYEELVIVLRPASLELAMALPRGNARDGVRRIQPR